MNNNSRIAVAEFFGTMILVIGGCGTAILDGDHVGRLGVATAFGLSLLVMAYTIGPISGCHINPAVTLGMLLAGKIEAAKLPVYWAAQVLGGIAGGAVLFAIVKGNDALEVGGFASNGFGAHSPDGFPLISVLIVEIVMTAIFAFAVLATTRIGFPTGFGGMAAGFALWLVHLISIGVSNTSVNPARSLGVAIFADSWAIKQVWAFWVFPLIGAVLGAVIFKVVEGDAADLPVADASGTT